MNPIVLMELLIIASGAKTPEEKARVCWRANDYMWREFPKHMPIGLCRGFNNLCQDQNWPWVDNLWNEKEIKEWKAHYGL